MALVTWEDIGSSLTKAEENVASSMMPTEQNFPIELSNGTLKLVDTSYESIFQSKVEVFKNLDYSVSNSGALKGGYIALKEARFVASYSTRLYQDLMVIGYQDFEFENLYGSQTGDVSGAFILRVPHLYNSILLYDFYLCCTASDPRGGMSYGSANTGMAYSTSNLYVSDAQLAFGTQTVDERYYINIGSSGTNQWYDYLIEIKNAISVNGYGSFLSLRCASGVNYNFFPGIQGSDVSTGINQSFLVSTNLPIWDITEESHSSDIIQYLYNGSINNSWYGGSSSAYEPAVDTTITDTTTVWYVQALYDTNPLYRINYKCDDLGTSSKDVREEWRANIYVDSIIDIRTNETIRSYDKSDIVLYDRAYTSHQFGIVKRYADIYALVNPYVDTAEEALGFLQSGSGWLSSGNSWIIRIAMCIYCSNQVSNIVYVDLKFDTDDGLEWGTITDNGDDSYVTISVVSTDAVEQAGGISNIEKPDADDGYTGVDYEASEEDFDYDEGSGEYPEDTITPVSGSGVSVGGKFCTTYQVSTAQLKAVSTYFWDDGSDGFISKYINAVNNPIESILSVGYMPVSVSDSSGSDSIFIGNVNLTEQASDCTGYTVDTTTRTITVGTLDIPEVYSSFLDYQPYTNLSIFLPYIGFKTLPPNLFMGKTIKVEYAFDLITGACKALLSANGKFVLSFDGDCMIKIPLTASNNSDVFMQRLRSAVEAGVALASAGIGSMAITSGGGKHVVGEQMGRTHKEAQLGRAMRRTSTWNETVEREPTVYNQHAYGGAVSQVVGSGLDIAMAKHTYETYGGASSATASVEPMSVYIVIDSPTVQYPSTYNHNCGKPCELSKYLSSLTGYTEVDNGIDLSGIPCTEAERDEIHRLLVSGVYL